MASGVVSFDYTAWLARFPQFTTTTDQSTGNACFEQACIMLNNTATSPVQDLNLRRQFLWLITAHIAQLMFGSSIQPVNPVVGRIASAAEGSVNFSAVMPLMFGNGAWYSQTQYGLMYWTATSPYRAFQYVAGPVRPIVPVTPGWNW